MTFEHILAIIRRSLPLVAIGVVGFGLVALVYTALAPHLYQATARVQLENKGPSIAANTDTLRETSQIDAASVDTEVEYIESRPVAERVVRDANLMRDAEFGAPSFEASVDKFAKAIAVRRVSTTYFIDVAVTSRSARRAADLANRTARAYVLLQSEGKRAKTLDDNRLLRDRVDGMASEVQRAEAEVQRFRIANNLLSVNGTTLAEQSAAAINDQLSNARAQERAALAEYSSAAGSGAALDAANAQQSLGSLRVEQSQAMQAMSEAETRYGASHPNYVAAQQRLREIDAAIAGETARARAAVSATRQQQLADLRAKAAAATNQRRSLAASSGANAAGLAGNSRAATELGELERRAQAVRSTYETYLQRYQQTLTQLGTERSNASIVAPASPPTGYYKPDLKLNLAFGVLAGLLAGVSVATLGTLLASHFSTAQQVEDAFDVDALPSLPLATSIKLGVGKQARTDELLRAMVASPTGGFAEMHKNLLVAISRPVDGKPNQVVAVTSALPREGKTTGAICLAAVAAHAGRRTLLVDCDQRRRTATRELVGDPTIGLSSVVEGTSTIEAAVVDVGVAGLDLLPASGSEDSSDLFGSDAFTRVIETLRQRYDLIIIDTAPVLPIADTRLIVERADSILVFCHWRSTPRRAVEAALSILGRSGVPIAGVSLTLVDMIQQTRFGYGDPTFYYAKYKDYYAKAV